MAGHEDMSGRYLIARCPASPGPRHPDDGGLPVVSISSPGRGRAHVLEQPGCISSLQGRPDLPGRELDQHHIAIDDARALDGETDEAEEACR